MSRVLAQITKLLQDAEKNRTWGSVEIDVRDGKPVLIRSTVQTKVDYLEDNPHARFDK